MKKRIAFLSRDLGKVNRGVETHVLELSSRLSDEFDIEILTNGEADSLSKILKQNFDLVIPTNGRLQALKTSLGRVFGGYKLLIVGHAGIGKDDIWNLLMFPDVFVALTNMQLKWAKKWSIKTRLVKIPNGVDLEKFSPIGKKAVINLESPIILSVGTLEWYKHHDLTIKAVSKMSKGSLLIIGRGLEQQKLEALGKSLLSDKRFKILNVDYDHMPEFYRAADLFTLPSWRREAFGIVYLEAMATNLAVVAPNDSSRMEIIGKAGILVNTADINLFAQSLCEALETKWGDLPRLQAEKFSWDKIAQEYKYLFESLINQ